MKLTELELSFLNTFFSDFRLYLQECNPEFYYDRMLSSIRYLTKDGARNIRLFMLWFKSSKRTPAEKKAAEQMIFETSMLLVELQQRHNNAKATRTSPT